MGASTLVSVEVGGGPKTAEERPHGHGIHEAPLEPPGPGVPLQPSKWRWVQVAAADMTRSEDSTS